MADAVTDFDFNLDPRGGSGRGASALARPVMAPEGAHAFTAAREALPQDVSLVHFSDHEIERMWAELGVQGIIKKMDMADVWAVDGREPAPRTLTALNDSIAAIYDAATHGRESALLDCAPQIAQFLGHLRSSRALALFRWMMERSPGMGLKLIQDASAVGEEIGSKEEAFLLILYQRVRVLERSRILSRVFAPERIAALLEAIDDNIADIS